MGWHIFKECVDSWDVWASGKNLRGRQAVFGDATLYRGDT